jgi:hypothetical protein
MEAREYRPYADPAQFSEVAISWYLAGRVLISSEPSKDLQNERPGTSSVTGTVGRYLTTSAGMAHCWLA